MQFFFTPWIWFVVIFHFITYLYLTVARLISECHLKSPDDTWYVLTHKLIKNFSEQWLEVQAIIILVGGEVFREVELQVLWDDGHWCGIYSQEV